MIMKIANSFYWSFVNTLILNVATIAAIVVGIVQFLVCAYKDNNGAQKTRKVIQTVLQFVDKIVSQLLPLVDTDVPVVEVAQKTTKRR
jgi:heme/copper-type cytochrome/quinol oxidase subunit 2